ncbi:hypothetical protein [Sporomusa sp.]|jgi:hypothetical protein|nr:hypothetical protein [Sporomusa sp.]HWR07328.1 hypothetical protein [Sporomusa sp.]
MDNVTDKLKYNLTEEELRELLSDLPNIIRDLNDESNDSEKTDK